MGHFNHPRLFSPAQLVVLLFFIRPTSGQVDDCRVPADADILGLGVRIGLYLQTASTLLVALVNPEEWAGSYIATGLFFLSFFIAVIFSVAQHEFPPGAVVNCTWYPVLVMTALTPIDFGLYRPGERLRRLTVYVVCLLTSGCLSVWFWFKGVDIKDERQCMEPRVFFFYNFSAYGDVRTFFKCFSVGFLGVLLIAMLIGFIPTQMRGRDVQTNVPDLEAGRRPETMPRAPQSARTFPLPSSSSEHREGFSSTRAATLPTQLSGRQATIASVLPAPLKRVGSAVLENQQKVKQFCWFVPSTIVWLSFYIVASELQLKWNHLEGINSVSTTGQIIPLSLGCLSLFRTLYLLRHVDWLEMIKIPPLTYAEVWHYKLGELEAQRRGDRIDVIS